MSFRLRSRSVGCAVVAALIGAIAPLSIFAQTQSVDQASISAEYQFEIPAQPLGDALQSFARASRQQVSFDSALIQGKRSSALLGSFTAEAAIRHLLAGSGLQFRLGSRGVWIISAAQGDTPESGSIADSRDALEEIIVTGTNIRGVQNPTMPLTVLDRSYIDSTGYGTVTRLIESLPQNFALINQSGFDTPGTSSSREQGASVDLRGIGEGATLILLNGRRLAPGFFGSAVDISSLPLTAIERVEVLTSGASAIYGADAVGGVVNFVLRRDFEGLETRARYGAAEGVAEYRLSQAAGTSWGSGNLLVSGEYYDRDLLPASKRSFVPPTSDVGSLLPRDRTYSLFGAGRQELTPSLAASLEAFFSDRSSFNRGGLRQVEEENSSDNSQFQSTAGIAWEVGSGWQLSGTASYAENVLDRTLRTTLANVDYDVSYETTTGELKADGPLFAMPAGDAKAAVGIQQREEDLAFQSTGRPRTAFDQAVRSAFGEVLLPLIDDPNARMVRRATLSVAGRYDDYSSFGSSFDPQVGLMVEPVDGLKLRGSYGTSYRAPRLIDYDTTQNFAFALPVPDPASPTGFSNMLGITGTVADFQPQQSENVVVGFEFVPAHVPGLTLRANYYSIEFEDRIAAPSAGPGAILADPASFSEIITREPTTQQVLDVIAQANLGGGFLPLIPDFTPESVDVIVDRRTRNLSSTTTKGVDIGARYDFTLGHVSLSAGADATYVLERQQQLTETAAAFETVDTIYNIPKLRARASLTASSESWTVATFVNFTGASIDNRTAPPSRVRSHLTVDAHASYRIQASDGLLSGVRIALSAENVFDRAPPPVAGLSPYDPGFDSTNASPLGRFISAEISKQWR